MPDVLEVEEWPAVLRYRVDLAEGRLPGAAVSERRLSDLRACFADATAYDLALGEGDPVVYTVTTAVTEGRAGALTFGLGRVMPGRVGEEFFLTKGHYHERREAAEVYLGLGGSGGLVLQKAIGDVRFVPLASGEIVYVPGDTAHRTVNTGPEPFTYLGVYSVDAGHDYEGLAEAGFDLVVAAGRHGPVEFCRRDFLETLTKGREGR